MEIGDCHTASRKVQIQHKLAVVLTRCSSCTCVDKPSFKMSAHCVSSRDNYAGAFNGQGNK
jgi:hypothetical protein